VTVVFRPGWTRQPSTRRPLDESHPLVKGLVLSCYNTAADYSAAPINYVVQNRYATSSTRANVSYTTGALGVSATWNGSSSTARSAVDLTAVRKGTISFWLWWDSFANNDHIALEYTGNYNSNNAFLINPNSSTTSVFDFAFHAGSGQHACTISRSGAGAWHHYAWCFDLTLASSQTTAIYKDGVSQSFSVTVNTMAAMTFSATDSVYIMNRGLASLFAAGRMSNLNIHSRILSADEIRSLMNNPWQIMQPLRRAVYTPPAIAGAVAESRWFLTQ
jgi:hypothetical protein